MCSDEDSAVVELGEGSAWALHLLNQQSPDAVAALLTTVNESMDRVAMHGRTQVRPRGAGRRSRPAAAGRAHPASLSQRDLRGADARRGGRRVRQRVHARGARRSVSRRHPPLSRGEARRQWPRAAFSRRPPAASEASSTRVSYAGPMFKKALALESGETHTAAPFVWADLAV